MALDVLDGNGTSRQIETDAGGGGTLRTGVAVKSVAIPATYVALVVQTINTVAGTIGAVGTATQGIYIQSRADNTSNVYIGGPGVTSANGMLIVPGDRLFLPISSTSGLYAVSVSGSQKIEYLLI